MKRRLLLSAGAAASALVLTGCAGPQISDFAGQKPALDLRQYFNGTLDAYGVFTDRSGAVVKRFTVVMRCTWTGEDGVLDEDFTYSDGTTQKRIWRMKHLGNGRYSGTADDVVGTALGETQGNTFRWGYTLALPIGGTSDAGPPQGASAPTGGSAVREATSVGATIVNVEFDDWMYLMDDRVMLNKATMSKFGVRLGEVTLSFIKR